MYTGETIFGQTPEFQTIEEAKEDALHTILHESIANNTRYDDEVIVKDRFGNIVYDSRNPQQKQETSTFLN